MITAPRLFCITAPPPQRHRLLRSAVPKPRRNSPPSFLTANPLKASVFPFFRRPPLVLLLRSSFRLASSSSSMEAPPPGYRTNVGICLVNGSSKIFAASRLDIPGAWQMPQGGVNEGEDPREAAVRELREETGVVSAHVLAQVPYWLTYDFPPDVKEKLNKQWGTNWNGQAQKWFLLRFTGKDDEVNLLGDGTEKAEFAEWSWMTPEQVLEHAVAFKKPVYEEVLKEFAPYLCPNDALGSQRV